MIYHVELYIVWIASLVLWFLSGFDIVWTFIGIIAVMSISMYFASKRVAKIKKQINDGNLLCFTSKNRVIDNLKNIFLIPLILIFLYSLVQFGQIVEEEKIITAFFSLPVIPSIFAWIITVKYLDGVNSIMISQKSLKIGFFGKEISFTKIRKAIIREDKITIHTKTDRFTSHISSKNIIKISKILSEKGVNLK